MLDWELRFTQQPTLLACAYWQGQCRGRRMPQRSDLNPVAMRKFTEHVGLIDVRPDAETDYFIRRAGTEWERVFGPMTGKFIHEFLPPEIETRWRHVFGTVCGRVAPARATTGIRFQRKTWLQAEMLVAPIGDDEVTMLFMTFVAWSGE